MPIARQSSETDFGHKDAETASLRGSAVSHLNHTRYLIPDNSSGPSSEGYSSDFRDNGYDASINGVFGHRPRPEDRTSPPLPLGGKRVTNNDRVLPRHATSPHTTNRPRYLPPFVKSAPPPPSHDVNFTKSFSSPRHHHHHHNSQRDQNLYGEHGGDFQTTPTNHEDASYQNTTHAQSPSSESKQWSCGVIGLNIDSPIYVARNMSGFPPTPSPTVDEIYLHSNKYPNGDPNHPTMFHRRNSPDKNLCRNNSEDSETSYWNGSDYKSPLLHRENASGKPGTRSRCKADPSDKFFYVEDSGFFPLCLALLNISKHLFYRFYRFLFCLFCYRQTCPISLTGVCFGITMGMFIGIYIETCNFNRNDLPWLSQGSDEFSRSAFRGGGVNLEGDDLRWSQNLYHDPSYSISRKRSNHGNDNYNDNELMYHSLDEDGGYQPRVINSSKGGVIRKPAGSVSLVRPYFLASELGIVPKTILAFVTSQNNIYPDDGIGGGSRKDTLTGLIAQIGMLERNLRHQMSTLSSTLAFSGKKSPTNNAEGEVNADDVETYLSIKDSTLIFHNVQNNERGAAHNKVDGTTAEDPTFTLNTFLAASKAHASVLGGSSNDLHSHNPPLIGKIYCFFPANSSEALALFSQYFPHLVPMLLMAPSEKLATLKDEHGGVPKDGVKGRGGDDDENDDNSINNDEDVRAKKDIAAAVDDAINEPVNVVGHQPEEPDLRELDGDLADDVNGVKAKIKKRDVVERIQGEAPLPERKMQISMNAGEDKGINSDEHPRRRKGTIKKRAADYPIANEGGNDLKRTESKKVVSNIVTRIDRLLLKFVRFVPLEGSSPSTYVSNLVSYLVDRHGQDSETFFLASPGNYLRLTTFIDFLGNVRRGQETYVGLPNSRYLAEVSDVNEKLPKQMFSSPNDKLILTEDFCALEAGILVGQNDMINIRNNLVTCLDYAKSYDSIDFKSLFGHDRRFQHILGICMSQILQRKCQTHLNGKKYQVSPMRHVSAAASLQKGGNDVNESILIYDLTSSPTSPESKVDEGNGQLAYLEKVDRSYQYLDLYYNEVDLRNVEKDIEDVKDELTDLAQFLPDSPQNKFFVFGVPPPSFPTNHFDVILWIYFNETHLLLPNEVETIRTATHSEKYEIREVIDYAKTKFLSIYPNLTFVRFINGYMQNDPARGIEYILDFEFLTTPLSQKSGGIGVKERFDGESLQIIPKRCHIMRPLGQSYVTYVPNDLNALVPEPYLKQRRRHFSNDPAHNVGGIPNGGPGIVEEPDVMGEADDLLDNEADQLDPPVPSTLINYLMLPVWAHDHPSTLFETLEAFTGDPNEKDSPFRASSIRRSENTRILFVFLTLNPLPNVGVMSRQAVDTLLKRLNATTVPADAGETDDWYVKLVENFNRVQAERLNLIKQRLALKKNQTTGNLGWFTLPLNAKFAASRLADGPGSLQFKKFLVDFVAKSSGDSPSILKFILPGQDLTRNQTAKSEYETVVRAQNTILNSFVFDGSLALQILDTFATKLHQKYGDERYSYDNQSTHSRRRTVNLVSLLTSNARIMAKSFLALSQATALLGRRVGFPIPFQRYDPSIAKPTYEGYPPGYKYDLYSLKTSTGHFDILNWGPAVFYLADYLNARDALQLEHERQEKLRKGPLSNFKSFPDEIDVHGLGAKWYNVSSLQVGPPLYWDLPRLFLTYGKLLEKEHVTRLRNSRSYLRVDWNAPENQFKDNFKTFEVFRYVEQNIVMEHDPWEISNCPTAENSNESNGGDPYVTDFLYAMTNSSCWNRNYKNVGTNVQMSFKIFESKMGVNISLYEKIIKDMRNPRKH